MERIDRDAATAAPAHQAEPVAAAAATPSVTPALAQHATKLVNESRFEELVEAFSTNTNQLVTWAQAQFGHSVVQRIVGAMTPTQKVSITFISNGDDGVMALERKLNPGAVAPVPGRGAGTAGPWLPSEAESGQASAGTFAEMVQGVLARANGRKIDKLTFIGHGHAGAQRVGTHAVMNDSMTAAERAELAKLAPHFAANAEVILDGCSVGAGTSGEKLLIDLATLWNVRVRAGLTQQMWMPGIEGSSNVATPGHDGKSAEVKRDTSMFHKHNAATIGNHSSAETRDLIENMRSANAQNLRDFTIEYRYYVMQKLLMGSHDAASAALAVELWSLASLADRREIYRWLDGNAWTGQLQIGAGSLLSGLTAEQRARVTAMLS